MSVWRDYYLDSVDGNDAWDGNTPETAWKTITKLNTDVLDPFLIYEGSRILFKRGCTFSGLMAIWNDGTANQRITFGAYGTGDLPIITGTPASLWNGILTLGGDYITVQNIHWQATSGAGVHVYATEQHCIVEDCEFDDPTCIAVNDSGEHTIVRNNSIHDLKLIATAGEGAVALGLFGHYGEVYGNEILRCLDTNVYAPNGEGWAFEFYADASSQPSNYEIHDNWVEDCGGTVEFGASSTSYTISNIHIYSNVFVDNRVCSFWSVGGSYGVQLDNVVFESNTIVESNSGAWSLIHFDGGYPTDAMDLTFTKNIICLDGSGHSVSNDDTWIHTNNCYWLTTGATLGGFTAGATEIQDDPDFVDQAGSDYHLRSTTPCPDWGAYPYEGSTTTTVMPLGTEYTEYKVIVYAADGTKLAEVTDFQTLVVARKVNAPGMIRFRLAGDHAAVGLLEDKSLVEAWRRDRGMGMDWTLELVGLYRYQKRQYTDRSLFEAMCPGVLCKLGWRQILWYAGTASRTKFTGAKAETIMKTLTSYNAGASATVANGRLREGAITGLSVETDASHGNTIDHFCSWDNLLESLQAAARIGGGDFDLVRTGAATFEFRWYLGQLGTDRHTTVTFALEYGNMGNPVYEYDRMDERTVALVGGQGEAGARDTTEVTGPDYAADNDIETFVDARDVDTADGRTSRGNKAMDEKRARPGFSFQVLQTPGCFYGLHYFLGDLCTARYDVVEQTVKVMGVTMTVDEGGEKVEVETEIV